MGEQTKQIALTQQLNVANAAHILYLYTDENAYIENAASFIQAGISQYQRIIFIDSQEHWVHLQARMPELALHTRQDVMYVENNEFYRCYEDFHLERVLQNLKDVVDPFIQEGVSVRLWGLVEYRDAPDIITKLHTYECHCDMTISELGYLTVCAYHAYKLPASIALAMMKTHEYVMTDNELFRSPLYTQLRYPSNDPLPSLTEQVRMESEMDLYRQKLDFVHVVSHEVRNPLTIVQAYASILSQMEDNETKRSKLKAILDYCTIIDYEISHILETEQMLVTESIWKKSLVMPRTALNTVLNIMETKARTQNIHLVVDNSLSPEETCICNLMSLRLIFSNLISNALKYSHEGSTVMVKCHIVKGFLRFIVQDQGIGMTQEQLSRLFRKYEKQNAERSGQGIGLFMVKTLVDDLGGGIQVESRFNEGTRVEVSLPMDSVERVVGIEVGR
ncbi:MEDS domain-containing protein [Alicyclobacillus tolerans]|uniref:ATP-binding protein n=1 Tax=Alicyclobacillus tolerans TaxID=90970 RepID=UPI001F3C1F10|nr:ATP-binding protein [Alicyclobacillus tolerans]MCF8564603.1 MEDS domain-containing protein [Alicyclobacillus tolerans]